MEQPPPTARSLVPEIPEALDQLVSRCLDPDPAKRFQTTDELATALGRLDDEGKPLPIHRVFGMRVAVAALGLFMALAGGHLVVFERVRGAGSARSSLRADCGLPEHDQRSGIRPHAGTDAEARVGRRRLHHRVRPRRHAGARSACSRPTQLDEAAARGLAVNQGLGVVLAGSIEPQGNGYRISVNATQAVTGEAITRAQARAASKDQVLDVATRLITRVRSALGDEASSSAQMFAMASLSATSLEVVRYWVAGREAASRNNYDEAMRNYSKAVELDPKFGLGYAGLANVSSNLTNEEDAEKYIKEALRYVDGMTERERYTTRGGFYRLTGDYRQCVKEYSELLAAYPADVAAHNNLAICLANLRDFAKAFDEVRQVVAILPNRALYRVNLASFANFSSDFQTAEQEARKIKEPDVNALMALAFAQVGQGQLAQAVETYQIVARISDFGASLGTSGLGDLAGVEGRFADSARILEQGAAQDFKFKRADWAAAKLAALAHTELRRGRPREAIAAGEKALVNGGDGLNVQFMVARAFVEAGDVTRARPLIAAMAKELLAEPRAYAKIVEGEIALKSGNPQQAIEVLTEANTLLDTWLGHYNLGRAYLDAQQFPQADSEFDRCLKRQGRGAAIDTRR